MSLSVEACRRIKAVFLIGSLAVAEIHQIREDVRLYTGPSLQSGGHSDVGTKDGVRDSVPNLQPHGEFCKLMEFIMANPETKLFAEQIDAMLTNWNVVHMAKRVAEKIEAMMADPDLHEQATRVAEQVETMRGHSRAQKQSKLLAKQIKAMNGQLRSDKDVSNLARQMYASFANTSLHEQAKMAAEHLDRLVSVNLQKHVLLVPWLMSPQTEVGGSTSTWHAGRNISLESTRDAQDAVGLLTTHLVDTLISNLFEKALKALPRAGGATSRVQSLREALTGHGILGRRAASMQGSATTRRSGVWAQALATASVGVGLRGIGPCAQLKIHRRHLQPPKAGKRKTVDSVVVAEDDKAVDVAGLAIALGSAAIFCVGVFALRGSTSGQEWLAGYLLEQSLSVDNLFVFVLVFDYFQVAEGEPQKRILSAGILGAAVLRAIFVLLGAELIENFEPVLLVFAAILIFSSYKILLAGKSDEEEDLSENLIVKACKSVISVSDKYDGSKFFTVAADGSNVATPLLLALVVIELSDLVFAVDSVPAVFGITRDPFIIYSSNMFAIFSLRSLYTFVATGLSELRFLEKAVGIILGFIGFKLVASFAGMEVSTEASLGIVCVLLAGGTGLSLAFPEEEGTKS